MKVRVFKVKVISDPRSNVIHMKIKTLFFSETTGYIDIDIDIEDLFTVEYYKPINISSVAL